ncbi:MAG: sugar phosphate isomerase/epimerase [Lachnospiraceae bacterium]|nr:sugar phosphate isomerase/epimerase [Lachnospiraceae bacterium]
MSKLPVAVQVYGLRDLLQETPERFEEVMKAVKEIGYDGVELAGLYGLDPAYIREVLDRVGLVPISAHVPFNELWENLDKAIEDYKTLGVTYMVMPHIPEQFRPANPEGFIDFLGKLPEMGKKIKAAGMEFLYHNHDFEFVRLPEGDYGYDRMFEIVPADLLAPEIDTCWCNVATGMAAEYVKKYSGRLPVVHLKDYIKSGSTANMYELIGVKPGEVRKDEGFFEFRPVGFGQMIWEPILENAIAAGSKWVVVEQDRHYDLSPLECARRSREYLKILGW